MRCAPMLVSSAPSFTGSGSIGVSMWLRRCAPCSGVALVKRTAPGAVVRQVNALLLGVRGGGEKARAGRKLRGNRATVHWL